MKIYSIQPTKEFLGEVSPIVEDGLRKSLKLLKLKKKINVHVSWTDSKYIIKKLGGSSGYTTDEKNIHIDINTKTKGWENSVLNTISHEFNHTARMQYIGKDYSNKDWFLVDTMALEGLGQVFEEVVTEKTAPYSKAISQQKALKLWKVFRPQLFKFSDNFYRELFFGYENKYPHWAGYTISYLIVKKRVAELGLNWEKLVGLDSKKLIGKGLG